MVIPGRLKCALRPLPEEEAGGGLIHVLQTETYRGENRRANICDHKHTHEVPQVWVWLGEIVKNLPDCWETPNRIKCHEQKLGLGFVSGFQIEGLRVRELSKIFCRNLMDNVSEIDC